MRVYSWNVNGLRAVVKKGFVDWLGQSGGAIVGLQETRCGPEQLPAEAQALTDWHLELSAAERPGYSGVATLSRHPPTATERMLDHPEIDAEGRLLIQRFGPLQVVNGYFPNGAGKERDNSRVPFKLDFYRRLFDRLEPARAAGEPVLVMGDFNTAHQDIDLARPKENRKISGFLPEECEELDRWIRAGWSDSFRLFESGSGFYSWWSQRFGVRAKNIGWRIDYILVSPGLLPFVRGAAVHADVSGSDHCPVSLDLDESVLSS